MLSKLVKAAQMVVAACCLAFVVLLFFQPDDPAEVQAGPAQAFPEEAEAAIEACVEARTEGNSAANCPEPAAADQGAPTTTAAPAEQQQEEPAGVDGADVFAGTCATCHGGDGGGGIGPNLQEVNSVDLVIATVSNGRGSMPSFDDRLDEAEIEAVADYVVNEL